MRRAPAHLHRLGGDPAVKKQFEEALARTQKLVNAALRANPEWEAYARQVRPMIVAQENRLLMPAPFSPLR